QSGWAGEDTEAGLYGPYSQIGLTWARPPSAVRTAAMAKNNPTDRAAYVGHSVDPTTFVSVVPLPRYCVCFWCQIRARWTLITPTTQLISRGRRKAPVKKIRMRWTTMAATNTFAAQ